MRFTVALLLLLGIRNSLYAQEPAIVINEFMAANVSTYADIVDFGDYSDWIELYNAENIPVDISGFYLTDDLTNPTKWQFPLNTVLPAKGFYVLWADDFDDIPGQEYTRNWWPGNVVYTTQWGHTNFKLAQAGEEIGLFNAAGQLIDSITYGAQTEDVSFGRSPDGGGSWFYFGEPTPNHTNSTEALSASVVAKEVVFSEMGGFYNQAISVELSTSNGEGTVRYTLDGTVPKSSSAEYSVPISITQNTILTARVFATNKVPGKPASSSYFINEARTLPAFSIITDPALVLGREKGIYRNTLKEREIPVNFEFFPLQKERAFSQQIGMRIGGENIYRFAQKPLNLYAGAKYGAANIEYPVFEHLPYQAYKRLYLRNSGDDWPYTMMRDGMIASMLTGEIANATQAYRPTVLYLNGAYWGLYNLREKLDKQYFSLHYSTAEVDLDHLEANAAIIEGDNADYLALLEFAANEPLSDADAYARVVDQVDLQNLMDFVITQAYLGNSSWGHNREMWRDRGNDNKWRWVLVDMDRGFNDSRIGADQLGDIYNNFDLFRYLCANTVFKNEFVQRYAERINTTFAPARVISIIDSIQAGIAPEIPRHIEKWGTYIDSLTIDEWGQTAGISSLNSWNTEVETFRTFARQRPENAINHVAELFDLEDRAGLTITSNTANTGKVDVQGFFKNMGESGSYFKNIPLTIKAYAPAGYTFKAWNVAQTSSSQTTLISAGSEWHYFDEGTAPEAWASTQFDHTTWQVGTGVFGYGDNQDTEISYGGDSQNKHITAYFRTTFTVDNAADLEELVVKILRDDGAIVYLNGQEIVRSNMPNGTILATTIASSTVGSADEDTYFEYMVPATALATGENVLAVEVHQVGVTSSDLSFDASLVGTTAAQNVAETEYSKEEEIILSLQNNTRLIAQFEPHSTSFIDTSITSNVQLVRAESPYYVTENITVKAGAEVAVEPGVEILMEEGASITIQGAIHLHGTVSEPITLTSYYPGQKWAGLFFDRASAASTLTNVRISEAAGLENDEHFFAAVSAYQSTVALVGVHISNVTLPISAQYSTFTFEQGTIENVTMVGDYMNVNGGSFEVRNSVFEGNNIEDMDAIDLGFMQASTVIDGNVFRNFVGDNSDAIDVGDASKNVQITNNVITHCGDKAVSIGQGSAAYLAHNVFAYCNLGVGVKDADSFADIINTTFYANTIGVAAYQKVVQRGGGAARIKNSVFSNSASASISVDEFSSITTSYSLSDTDVLPGTGNIAGNAELINPKFGNYYPQITSPVLGAGDPTTPIDGGGRPINMGAFGFRGSRGADFVINEINYNSSDAFDTGDWVEFVNSSSAALDVSKWVFIDGSHRQTFVFNANTLVPAQGFKVIVREMAKFNQFNPSVSIEIDTMQTGLSGSGEALFLYDADGFLVDSLTYSDSSPWPEAADGNGASLELINPHLDNGQASHWQASITTGSPGATNTVYVVSSESEGGTTPSTFGLSQNFPNPFNPSTIITYQLPEHAKVSLQVFDLLGREVAVLVNERREAGYHRVTFNANNLASGMYIYRLTAGDYVLTKKLTLIK